MLSRSYTCRRTARAHGFMPGNPLCVRSGLLLCVMAACLLLCSVAPVPAQAAPAVSQLQKDLAKEQERASTRRTSLKRLTEQERRINADLATAEARILELEASLEAQSKKLLELSRDDDGAR